MALKLLILCRDEGWDGGVVHVVASIKRALSSSVEHENFVIGRRIGKRSFSLGLLQPLSDAVSLFRRTASRKYDLVHVNPSFNARSLLRDGLFMLTLRMTRQNVFIFYHGWNERLASSVAKSAFLRILFRFSYGYAQMSLVLADRFRHQLVGIGIPENKLATITTMFDGNQYRSLDFDRRVHGRTVLFLSRLIREKGVFELLDAFSRILKKYPDARLIMAGDGPARVDIQAAISAAGLKEVVSLPGYLRGIAKAEVLGKADIFVLATYYGEGCPVSLLEAMAAGLALVSTPVGGIPDILRDGENGVLLLSADPDQISQALERLMSCPEDLASISSANREKAWRCYEASVVTAKIEDYYKQVARPRQ